MSDLLVEWQDKLAQYPSWMVAGAAGFVLAVIFILIGKAMRVVGIALLVGVVAAAGWYLWENMSGRKESSAAPTPALLAPASESGSDEPAGTAM